MLISKCGGISRCKEGSDVLVLPPPLSLLSKHNLLSSLSSPSQTANKTLLSVFPWVGLAKQRTWGWRCWSHPIVLMGALDNVQLVCSRLPFWSFVPVQTDGRNAAAQCHTLINRQSVFVCLSMCFIWCVFMCVCVLSDMCNMWYGYVCLCVCVSWLAVSPGGKFYEHGNEAIIHYTAEQTRDYTGNYLIRAILQLAGSHGQHGNL